MSDIRLFLVEESKMYRTNTMNQTIKFNMINRVNKKIAEEKVKTLSPKERFAAAIAKGVVGREKMRKLQSECAKGPSASNWKNSSNAQKIVNTDLVGLRQL